MDHHVNRYAAILNVPVRIRASVIQPVVKMQTDALLIIQNSSVCAVCVAGTVSTESEVLYIGKHS
jgi:hypothetical protein